MGLSHPDHDDTEVKDIDLKLLYAISYAHLNHIYFVSCKMKWRLKNKKKIRQQDFNKLQRKEKGKIYNYAFKSSFGKLNLFWTCPFWAGKKFFAFIESLFGLF